jgi:hypothetical protein
MSKGKKTYDTHGLAFSLSKKNKKKKTCDTHGLAGESNEDMFAIRLERDHIRHDLVI